MVPSNTTNYEGSLAPRDLGTYLGSFTRGLILVGPKIQGLFTPQESGRPCLATRGSVPKLTPKLELYVLGLSGLHWMQLLYEYNCPKDSTSTFLSLSHSRKLPTY